MDYVLDNGIPRPKWAVEMVDAFIEKAKYRPIWEVIDFLVSEYLKLHPEYFTKEAQPLLNPFASTKDKGMRKLLNIPMDLKDIITVFYADEIKSQGDMKFWRAFARRYPMFSVAEKI